MLELIKPISIIILSTLPFFAFPQINRVIGLWEIKNVYVGDQEMNPVAKWSKINADGSFQSGNGWLQNASGTWTFDAENHLFSATDSLDIKDDFGGFTVSFDEEIMYWQRVEEGMEVNVTWVPIKELPMSPADYLEGLWDLEDIMEQDQSILASFDPDNKHRLFIRWDRIYMNFSPEGQRSSGYWHINGHKPEITLLPHTEGKNPESWRIDVNADELIMTGISDSNRSIQRRYLRKNSF